ncbi:MAG: alpha/beta fold hydrolase [Formosimonas sp.]
MWKWLKGLALAYVLLCVLVGCAQRKMLYFPSHANSEALAQASDLTRWTVDNQYYGYARIPQKIERVWLVLHGNAGQAAQRGYMLPYFKASDAVYFLEYPGYGERAGSPSKSSMNQAAQAAYQALVQHYAAPVAVLGESIGSGPASFLAQQPQPPARMVLLVPFDVISKVAQEKLPFLPAKLIMLDQWNNIDALRHYPNRLDIWGATHDAVIPVHHARDLAKALPNSRYHEFNGTHDWSASAQVTLDD